MPMTIDGDGSITGLVAGGLPDNSITAAEIADGVITRAKVSTSEADSFAFCRAWVNFNGTGTVAIRADFNVTSITDNGAGDYTVNFTNALPDTNFATLGLGYSWWITESSASSRTTTSVRINTFNTGSFTNTDQAIVNVAIFR